MKGKVQSMQPKNMKHMQKNIQSKAQDKQLRWRIKAKLRNTRTQNIDYKYEQMSVYTPIYRRSKHETTNMTYKKYEKNKYDTTNIRQCEKPKK